MIGENLHTFRNTLSVNRVKYKRKGFHMNLNRLFFATGLLLISLVWTEISKAQCNDCSHPRLALYDAQMLVPSPPTADSVVAWWTLQWPMAVVRSTLHNTDPTKDCVTWYDGALVNARDLYGDTLHIGIGYYNLPPAEEVVSADYLLTGSVSGSNGTFTLTVNLETAVSREVVLSQSAGYGYDVTSQQTAGQTIAAAFMPLFQIIHNFEVNKRNTDVTVAIRDIFTTSQEIIVTPKKTKINVGESVDVDIEMTDCDGVPLSNREITFEALPDDTILMIPGSTGGTVEPSTVTTDGSGKAAVKFTAGSTTSVGQIVAAYRHKKPCGRLSAFLGTAAIVIGQPTKPLWQVHVMIMEQVDRRIDTSWTTVNGSGSHLVTEITAGAAKIDMLVENGGNDTSSFFFVAYEELGDTFENAVVSGNWSLNYFKRYYIQGGGLPPDVDIQIKGYNGKAYLGSGQTGFEFHYPNNPTDLAIVAQAGGTGQGTSLTKSTVWSPEYHWEESSSTVPTDNGVYTEFNANECSITKSGTTYSISGSRTRTTHSSEQTTTRTVDLIATVSLYASPTDVEQIENRTPTTFNLQQNYPNPFNPSTTIQYELAAHSIVRLVIYNTLGQVVEELLNTEQQAGIQSVVWNANAPSGLYFYRLEATSLENPQKKFVESKKMLLLR
jgi:hypothetical protein